MTAIAKHWPTYGGTAYPDEIEYTTVQEAWLAMPLAMQEDMKEKRDSCEFQYNYEKGILFWDTPSGEYQIEDLGVY